MWQHEGDASWCKSADAKFSHAQNVLPELSSDVSELSSGHTFQLARSRHWLLRVTVIAFQTPPLIGIGSF